MFRFRTTQPYRLQDYDIRWGRVILSIEAACAHPIAREQAYICLLYTYRCA